MAAEVDPGLADPAPYDFSLGFPDLPFSDLGDFDPLDFLDFDLGDRDVSVDDFLAPPPSPPLDGVAGSGGCGAVSSSSSAASPERNSGGCASAVGEVNREISPGDVKSHGVKRKKACDEGGRSPSPSSGLASVAAEDEDPKRVARLMRNRESAHLSRQRKKKYVEELEEKVKSMTAAINDLNARINYFVAENATLRQQLAGSSASGGPVPVMPPPMFPPPPGMHFPWFAGYGFRPQGVPIPKLKPQQPTPAPKAKKADSKKNESKVKTKKVASVSLLGLLFLIFVFGAVIPAFNNNNSVDSGMGKENVAVNRDRVISASGHNVGLNVSIDTGSCSDNVGSSFCHPKKNSTESLPALLYVPRNGKHVKINGNLIIQSVLASEKAIAHRAAVVEDVRSPPVNDQQRSFPVAPYHSMSKEVEQSNNPFRSPLDPDGSFPQWFREGMAGPVLHSGMCTEVFQFDVSPAAHPTSIVPASSTFNSTASNVTRTIPRHVKQGRIKNRRAMYNRAIPLPGKTLNNTEPFAGPVKNTSTLSDPRSASSVIVSVLADPREAGDGDGDPRVNPKSLSRIFVVVLLDGVKYVTYSCVLPFKSTSPHLVN